MPQPLTFPEGFAWGASTAAYQVEGGATEGGRGQSIWDAFSHTPGKTFKGQTGGVAVDHYHRYKEDVALMKQMGLKAYRFSIAWPRIIPGGVGDMNEEGVEFYNKRMDFFQQYLSGVHEVISEGADVRGYFAWSLFDSYEWSAGFTIRFGLVWIDYDTLERTPKASADWCRDTIATNGFRSKYMAGLHPSIALCDSQLDEGMCKSSWFLRG